MGNAAMDWARQEARRTGSPDSWLNTPMGGNYLGALARNYKAPTTPDPYANFQNKDPLTDASYHGGKMPGADPYANLQYKDPLTDRESLAGFAKQQQDTATGNFATKAQPIQSANFGTYTQDALGSLQKMGMFSPPATNGNAANMAQFDRQMGDNRNMLAGLMTRENPFSANNSGYLASQAQIVGQQGRGLLNVLRDQRAKNALNGVTKDSGLAQNAERAMRTQSALQANGALTGLETDRYAKAANWDDANRQFGLQAIQALNSGDLSRFNALTQANQQQYDNARQQPFDALKYASGVQDFEQAGRMNPLELQYRQGQLTGQGIQNEAGRLGVQYTQQTQPGAVQYANATHNLGTLNANQQYSIGSDLYNDPTVRQNLIDTYKTQGQRGLIQARNGVMRDAMQPGRDFEQETMGRLGNYLNIGGSVFKLAGGLGG